MIYKKIKKTFLCVYLLTFQNKNTLLGSATFIWAKGLPAGLGKLPGKGAAPIIVI